MTTRSDLIPSLVLLVVMAAGCSGTTATGDGSGAPPTAIASSPGTTHATPPPKEPVAAADPAPSASAPAATAAPAAPTASAAAAPDAPIAAPLPSVKVTNIGMHVGGGPNDVATKDPIRRSVEPHFDEFRRCFAQADDPKKGGDFGVDLRIDKAGGKAKVSHPRTTLKGAGFRPCVVQTFEAIEFLKPLHGNTIVSYSLHFAP